MLLKLQKGFFSIVIVYFLYFVTESSIVHSTVKRFWKVRFYVF